MKKKSLVDPIENLKSKVVAGSNIQGLYKLISNCSENVDCLLNTTEKLNSESVIVRNVLSNF